MKAQRSLRRKVRVLTAQRQRLLRELRMTKEVCQRLQARWRGKESREVSS